MPLAPGANLSHYEILAPIGAGGMGEVYKARDTRLDRIVAIKVLPEHIAQREDLKARFEREARAVASLNHPHICVLYDIGQEQGVQYMVLEYLEGETLDARLQRGALPLDTALQYAMQTADALDRAHRAGVAHRDIKPANLMLTRDGVKVLDFGLAKSKAKPGPTEATIVASLTSEGTVLGTPQYMSPELFEGREADARADVWAFGAVLYEMVTGRKAFEGKNYSSLVGAILSTEPAPVAPVWLDKIIRRCLEKDPEDRWQSIRDVLLELRSLPIQSEAREKPPAARPWLAWAVAAIATAAALVLGAFHLRKPEVPVLTASLVPPGKSPFREIAVSPDGKMVAFTAALDGRRQLYVQSTQTPGARLLAPAEGVEFLFWSPDSRSIGFFAQNKLKRMEAAGGPVQTLCDVISPRGGSWSEQGVILAAAAGVGMLRVSDQGGTPSPVVSNRGAARSMLDYWPAFLPGGRSFLSTSSAGSPQPGIYLTHLDSGKSLRLLSDGSNALYSQDQQGNEYVIFSRAGTLLAQPFDSASGALRGSSRPVAEKAATVTNLQWTPFSLSRKGLLIYVSEGNSGVRQMVWLSRSGDRLGTVGKPGIISQAVLSPDQKSVAFDLRDGAGGDLWVHEFARGVDTRITFEPPIEQYPVWSPDSASIVYTSRDASKGGIHLRKASGGGVTEPLLYSSNPKFVLDWSAAAGAILFSEPAGKTRFDIHMLPLSGERKPVPLLHSEFNEQSGTLSPDGKHLAYVSDESGRYEVFVQTFPLSGAKWQVSVSGGIGPRWRKDGRELYFTNEGVLMAAAVTPGANFHVGTPVRLFSFGEAQTTIERYSVSADGQRFLFALPVETEMRTPAATIVLNALDQPPK
ncbi:MAG: protein kinase [Bryobacteraceae bacterium]